MSIYKSEEGKVASLKLYGEQLEKLGWPFNDRYVETSFGKTHIIETGNNNGEPLLVFHGGNSTTSYNLLMHKFLLKDFHIFAVDTIGHPGKSDEVSLSPRNYDYGKWASEVITELGYDKINCLGVSFGGGIVAKLICVAPNKVERVVLVVPAGIKNAFPLSSAMMMIPMIKYVLTKKERYLKETALYMAISEDVLDKDTLETVKDSFDNVKTKVGMPSNIHKKLLKDYTSKTLVMAGEKDCLFPAKGLLSRAKEIIPNCTTHIIKEAGHMHTLSTTEKNMIIKFLRS